MASNWLNFSQKTKAALPLTDEYFQIIDSKVKGAYIYYTIRPRYWPLVLMSRITGLPLAAITLSCQNTDRQNDELGTRGRAFFTNRLNKNAPVRFQGIVSKDLQEIEFILTNLCPQGMLKIDLLRHNTAVSEINPGMEAGAHNRVNEIYPFQSYAVRSDQKDNRPIMLRTIRRPTSCYRLTNEQMPVSEVEHNLTAGCLQNFAVSWPSSSPLPQLPPDFYWYISVVPQLNNPTLDFAFQDTFWECPDVIVLKLPHDDKNSINTASNQLSSEVAAIPLAGRLPSELASSWFSSEAMPETRQASESRSQRIVISPASEQEFLYNYHVSSNLNGELCSFCLSVSTTHFNALNVLSDDEIKDAGQIQIGQLHKQEQLLLYHKLPTIFKEDKCVVCFDRGIDSVLYPCGHQCCHVACIVQNKTRCPMCRCFISEILNIFELGL